MKSLDGKSKAPKKVLLVGGGSGGHIFPLIPVASELRSKGYETEFTTDKGCRFSNALSNAELGRVYEIPAGKYRRYPGVELPFSTRVRVLAANSADMGRTIIGFSRALLLLRKIRPDVIFFKGSSVSVPVGLAAATLGIPYVTHDSDLLPGLSNKLISRWAVKNLVGSKYGTYPYEPNKTVVTGIPIRSEFLSIKPAKSYDWDLLVVGGSQGAEDLNSAAVEYAKNMPDRKVMNVCGRDGRSSEVYSNLKQIDFIDDIYNIINRSKVVVSRSSSTFAAELSSLSKPVVFVPAPGLSDQKANARQISSQKAGLYLDQNSEDFYQQLQDSVEGLLSSVADSAAMGIRLDRLYSAKDSTTLVVGVLTGIVEHVGGSPNDGIDGKEARK